MAGYPMPSVRERSHEAIRGALEAPGRVGSLALPGRI